MLFYRKILIMIFAVFLSVTNNHFAQKIKITKVVDANLFELADGKLIKLAFIDVPNLNNKNLYLQSIAVAAYKYAKDKFLGKKFDLVYNEPNKPDSSYFLVSIVKKYPLLTLDFSEEYLKKGFGKFINNINNEDSAKYKAAEQAVKEEKKGIWQIVNDSDTLDQTFLGKELLTENAIDSIKVAYSYSPFLNKLSTENRIFIETLASPVFGLLGAIGGFGGGSAVASIVGEKSWGALGYIILSGYIGYLSGSSYGTYLIAKKGDRDITYGYSILSAFVGGVSGILLSVSSNGFRENQFLSYAPLFLPIVASIIYANVIAPKKVKTDFNVSYKKGRSLINQNYSFTYNDFYNSTKLIEINLIKINF